MNPLEVFESHLEPTFKVGHQLRITLDGNDFWITDPQAGTDFILGQAGQSILIFKTSLVLKIWEQPPIPNEVSFGEVFEQLSWPRFIKFELLGPSEMCLGSRDGFLKVNSGPATYFRALDSVNVVLIGPVDNSKPKL